LLHQVGDLLELNVKLRWQKVNKGGVSITQQLTINNSVSEHTANRTSSVADSCLVSSAFLLEAHLHHFQTVKLFEPEYG
jgi:hypothetical protein